MKMKLLWLLTTTLATTLTTNALVVVRPTRLSDRAVRQLSKLASSSIVPQEPGDIRSSTDAQTVLFSTVAAEASPLTDVTEFYEDVTVVTVDTTSQESSSSEPLSVAQGRILAIVAAAIYGTNFSMIKIIDEMMPMEWSGVARFGLAGLAAVALTPSIITAPAKNWKPLLGGMHVGFWYTLAYMFQAIGLQSVDAGKSAFFNTLAVLVVPIIDIAIKGAKITWEQGMSLLMAIIGVGLLQLGDAASSSLVQWESADLFCLGQAVFFGIGYWVLESVSSKHEESADVITAGQLVTVALGFLLYALAGNADLPSTSQIMSWASQPLLVGSILWTGLASTGLAVYLETVAVQAISASELTIIMTSVAVWGSIFAFFTMNEIPTQSGLFGGLFIVMGCILPSLQQSEEIPPPERDVVSFQIESID